MKIQTFTMVAGGTACNARCPYCVAKMTGDMGIPKKAPEVNWRNFEIACNLAKMSGVTTALITSKGEATLFPDQLTEFMKRLNKYNFPFVELQTNGIAIADNPEKYEGYLKQWYDLGLTTVAISHVHYEPELNRVIYTPSRPSYIDLPGLIGNLHKADRKFSVRLTTILAKGFVDNGKKLENLVEFARANKVEQLSVKPVTKPDKSADPDVYKWTDEHQICEEGLKEIKTYAEVEGTKIMTLPHGAVVYDVKGQNLCLTDCLTIKSETDDLRQIIFFPDGAIRYDWRYEGARLL